MEIKLCRENERDTLAFQEKSLKYTKYFGILPLFHLFLITKIMNFTWVKCKKCKQKVYKF